MYNISGKISVERKIRKMDLQSTRQCHIKKNIKSLEIVWGIAGDFDVEKQCFRNLAVTKDDQKLMPLNDNNNEAVALLPPNINLTKGAIEGVLVFLKNNQ